MNMERDIRATALFCEIERLCESLRQPGSGRISDAAEISLSPDGRYAAFSGSLMERLDGTPVTRICLIDLSNGETRILTEGPNIDRLPRFSPDGRQIAFLSDRHSRGDYQLHFLDPETRAVRA